MRRLTDLPVGTEVEVESLWHGVRLRGRVADRPDWSDPLVHRGYVPIDTPEEGVKLYAPYTIFVGEREVSE